MQILITYRYLVWFLLVKKIYKNVIGYKDDYFEIKPLHIMLPKTSVYVKNYDGETKWMSFYIKYGGLLKKYNDIQNKVSNGIKKELVCEPNYYNFF